jgi:hypothetical protein
MEDFRAPYGKAGAGLLGVDIAASLLGIGIRAFIEVAEREKIEALSTTGGRYYDRKDVRRIALKRAALAAAKGDGEEAARMKAVAASLKEPAADVRAD